METIKKDGRFKRSARSRQCIIESMQILVEQGQYIPTAQQVADQASISLRTVFRHFSEMEHLYKELNEAVRPSYVKYFLNQDISGSLDARIERLAKNRTIAHRETFNLCKSTHALMWRSTVLKEAYHYNQKQSLKMMVEMLPELKDKSTDIIEMADACTSFEMFDRYFTYQNLTVADCTRLFTKQLKMILSMS